MVYVFLEIRQNIWLWPCGIVTSAVYIWVFFKGKLYADMSLQCYYLGISCLGWYWWVMGRKKNVEVGEQSCKLPDSNNIKKEMVREKTIDEENKPLKVTRLKLKISPNVVFS